MEEETALNGTSQTEPVPVAWPDEEIGEEDKMGLTECQTPRTGNLTVSVRELESRIREIEATAAPDNQTFISQLADLAKPILDLDFTLEAEFQSTKFENSLKLGMITNKLYPVVTKTMKWGPWLKANFGVSASTIKNCRDIASRPDCHPYFRWGMRRVLKLITLTRKEEGDERIRRFLEKHHTNFDPCKPLTQDMKHNIDTLLAEAAKKPKKPVSVVRLTETLQKYADEFFQASNEELQELDRGKKGELADILCELIDKLSPL